MADSLFLKARQVVVILADKQGFLTLENPAGMALPTKH